MAKHYLLYGSERYALAILRPVQEAIRARGGEAAWFFDGPGAEDLHPDEKLLTTTEEVRRWNAIAVITGSNAVPHFFPGVKVETFHGFDAGKPRHIYIRGFFDLYCTTGPRDTAQFKAIADKVGHFSVVETGWPKIDPFMQEIAGDVPPVRQPPVILYHSTFSPSWSAAPVLYDEIARLSRTGEWRWIVTFHPKMDPEMVAKYRALEGPYLRFARNMALLPGGDRGDYHEGDGKGQRVTGVRLGNHEPSQEDDEQGHDQADPPVRTQQDGEQRILGHLQTHDATLFLGHRPQE